MSKNSTSWLSVEQEAYMRNCQVLLERIDPESIQYFSKHDKKYSLVDSSRTTSQLGNCSPTDPKSGHSSSGQSVEEEAYLKSCQVLLERIDLDSIQYFSKNNTKYSLKDSSVHKTLVGKCLFTDFKRKHSCSWLSVEEEACMRNCYVLLERIDPDSIQYFNVHNSKYSLNDSSGTAQLGNSSATISKEGHSSSGLSIEEEAYMRSGQVLLERMDPDYVKYFSKHNTTYSLEKSSRIMSQLGQTLCNNETVKCAMSSQLSCSPNYSETGCDSTLKKGHKRKSLPSDSKRRKTKSSVIYFCHHCDYSTKFGKHRLMLHIERIHIGINNMFFCHHCRYTNRYKSLIKEHIERVHLALERKYTLYYCHHCDFSSRFKAHLRGHIEKVHIRQNIKVFSCFMCGYRANIKWEVTHHLRYYHLKEKPFECFYCGYKTTYKNVLKRHIMYTHLRLKKPYRCPDCNFSSDNITALKSHKMSSAHRPQIKNKFQCSLCDFNSRIPLKVEKHARTTHGAGRTFKCSLCGLSLGAKFYKHHIETAHLEEGYFKCVECDFKTLYKLSLDKHIRSVHKGEKPFSCPHCDHKASQMGHIKTHIQLRHEGSKPLKCLECDFKTSLKSSLKLHINLIHKNIRPFECPHCQSRHGSITLLKTHINKVHERVKQLNKCPECDFKAFSIRTINRHVKRIHRGEIQEKPHKCHQCSYKSACKSILRNHIAAIHEGLKPFKCALCSYSAARKSHLRDHLLTVHSNEKPYECPHCEYKSSMVDKVKSHIKIVHNKEKPHKCPHCEYWCSQRSTIKVHVLAVHGSKKSFKCAQCDYRGKYKGALQIHVKRVHLGIKECRKRNPFKCPFCGMKHQTRKFIWQHMSTDHRDKIPLTCHYCGQFTAKRTVLKRHIAAAHQQDITSFLYSYRSNKYEYRS